MTTAIAIVGVGGQGRECLDIVQSMASTGHDVEFVGFYDDAPSADNVVRVKERGFHVLGSFDDLLRTAGLSVCLGIGEGVYRAHLDLRLQERGVDSAILVHPESTVGSEVHLAPGSVIFAGARLTTNITIGRHVHVNQNATVAHDCVLEDYVTVNPQATISGSVAIRSGALVGANATVLQGRRIGRGATVGAGACVTKDVPDAQVVKGVPAR